MARINVWLVRDNDRPNYRLVWVEPGTKRRKSKSTGTTDEAAAERARAELEYELNHGLHQHHAKISWGDFCARYESEKLADRRKNTRRKWETVSRSFVRLAAPRDLGSVDASMLSRYQAQLRGESRSKATVSGHLAYLRAALRWAARLGLTAAAPAVEMPKLPRKVQIRRTDQAGFLRLLNAAPEGEWRLLISVAWYTGRRRTEMLAIEWNDENGRPWFDFERSRYVLPAEWNKGDADFWLPLHPDLLAVLLPWRRPAGRVFVQLRRPNTVSEQFRGIADRAGLPGFTLHDLKRSFASRYATKVPAQQLQRLCGHGDIRTTLSYYADLNDGLEEAIRLA